MPKPDKLQAIAIMQLISGILAILVIVGSCGTAFLLITPIYGFVVAILEVVSGARGLGQNPRLYQSFYRTVAIMEIVNIITCNVPAMVVGILVLSFLKDPEVEAFFAGTWQPRVPQVVVQQPVIYQIPPVVVAPPVQTIVPPPPAQPIVVPPPSPPAENGKT